MTFTRVLKSALCGALFMFLAYQGLWEISEMPVSYADMTSARSNPVLIEVAVWAWVLFAGWSGIMAGLMHASPQAGVGARKRFRGAVEFLFWAWLAFFLAHLLMLAFFSLQGGSLMAVVAFLVAESWLLLWMLTQPRESTAPRMPSKPGWSM